MSTKIVDKSEWTEVDYKFGFIPSKDYNPIMVITEYNNGLCMGTIYVPYESLDCFIHHLKGMKHHPNLWDWMDVEDDDSGK